LSPHKQPPKKWLQYEHMFGIIRKEDRGTFNLSHHD